jgi:hypothetical protein
LSASRSARTLYMEKLKLTRFSGKQATALKWTVSFQILENFAELNGDQK